MNKTDLTTAFEQTSFLYGGNAQFIEHLYAKYLENPATVDQQQAGMTTIVFLPST